MQKVSFSFLPTKEHQPPEDISKQYHNLHPARFQEQRLTQSHRSTRQEKGLVWVGREPCARVTILLARVRGTTQAGSLLFPSLAEKHADGRKTKATACRPGKTICFPQQKPFPPLCLLTIQVSVLGHLVQPASVSPTTTTLRYLCWKETVALGSSLPHPKASSDLHTQF